MSKAKTNDDAFAIDEHGSVQSTPVIGELVTKARFAAIISKAGKAITKMISAVVRKEIATRKETTVAISLFIRRDAALIEADEKSNAFDAANVKDARGRLREFQLRRFQRESIPLEEILMEIRNQLGKLRSRRFSVPGRIAEAVVAFTNPADVERAISAEIKEPHKYESTDGPSRALRTTLPKDLAQALRPLSRLALPESADGTGFYRKDGLPVGGRLAMSRVAIARVAMMALNHLSSPMLVIQPYERCADQDPPL